MPDTGASQTIVSLDADGRAKLKIDPTKTVLKSSSDTPMKLTGQSLVQIFYFLPMSTYWQRSEICIVYLNIKMNSHEQSGDATFR